MGIVLAGLYLALFKLIGDALAGVSVATGWVAGRTVRWWRRRRRRLTSA